MVIGTSQKSCTQIVFLGIENRDKFGQIIYVYSFFGMTQMFHLCVRETIIIWIMGHNLMPFRYFAIFRRQREYASQINYLLSMLICLRWVFTVKQKTQLPTRKSVSVCVWLWTFAIWIAVKKTFIDICNLDKIPSYKNKTHICKRNNHKSSRAAHRCWNNAKITRYLCTMIHIRRFNQRFCLFAVLPNYTRCDPSQWF